MFYDHVKYYMFWELSQRQFWQKNLKIENKKLLKNKLPIFYVILNIEKPIFIQS